MQVDIGFPLALILCYSSTFVLWQYALTPPHTCYNYFIMKLEMIKPGDLLLASSDMQNFPLSQFNSVSSIQALTIWRWYSHTLTEILLCSCHTTICQRPVWHLIKCLSTKINCLTFLRFRTLWNTKTQYKARFQSNSWFCLFSPSHGELKWIVQCLRILSRHHFLRGQQLPVIFIWDWQCCQFVSCNTTAATPQNV